MGENVAKKGFNVTALGSGERGLANAVTMQAIADYKYYYPLVKSICKRYCLEFPGEFEQIADLYENGRKISKYDVNHVALFYDAKLYLEKDPYCTFPSVSSSEIFRKIKGDLYEEGMA